jgi:prepilin-type N-terminal cleavage/methylation domain-containing protein
MKRQKNSGFTIVELLIVIVVVGILATILYLSYTGVQANAKTENAKANATVLQRKIEAYMAINNSYPDAPTVGQYTAELNSLADSSLTSANISINSGTLNGTQLPNTLEVSQCSSGANGTFYRIRYWDYAKKMIAAKDIEGSLGTSSCSSWTILS